MAGNLDFQTTLSANTNTFISAFRDATNTIANLGDSADASTQNLEQMSQYGQQHIQSLNLSLSQARAELVHLSTTNATPADIANAQNRIQLLQNAISQTTTVFDAYGAHAQNAMQNAANASRDAGNALTPLQQEVSTLVSGLDGVRSGLDENGNSATHTREQLEQMAENATAQLNRYKRQLEQAKLEVNRLAATNASPADIEQARQRVRELETGVGQVETSLDGYRNAARIANDEAASGANRSASAFDQVNQGVNGIKSSLTALAGAIGLSLGVRELAESADSYTNLSARIQQATKEGGDFKGAMAGVHQVALMTNSSLQATGDLFTRLNAVGKEMGMTQQQTLTLTKTVTQAIQIGGGSAQASEAAVTQFIQAMQGGVLRGEEFNSIMENGYGLAESLAKGLNVTTGELRKMAENGELSAERVITAVQKQATEVQATYDKFPTTIGNALTRIATSWDILIGKMDQSNGASATVAQWLVNLADNISELDVVLDDIGEGFVWVGDQLKKIDPATIEIFKTALLSAYDALKELGSTAGIAFEAVVDVINTVLQQLFSFGSGVDDASDKTNGFTKVLQVINIVIGALSDGFSAIGIGVNLFTGALYSVAAAWANLVSKFTWGDVKEDAIANMNAMMAKSEEFYQKASDGAMNFKSKTIEALKEINLTQDQKNTETLESSKATLDQLLADQKNEVEGKKVSEEAKLEAVQAYAEAAIQANNGVMDGVVQADLLTKGYVVTLSEAGNVSVEAWAKSEEALKKVTISASDARKAAKAVGLDIYELTNGITESFNKATKDVTTFANGLKALGIEGERAGVATYKAWSTWLDTAKSQEEVNVATWKLKEFGEQGKVSTAQVEQGMQAIRQVVMKLPSDLDPVEQAFERLGIKTKAQLALAAQSALADFNTIQSSGKATAWDLQEAYERTMQSAAASGDQAVISATQAKAASLGLEVQIGKTGTATVKSYDELKTSLHGVNGAFRNIESGARSASNTMREEAKSSTEAWNDAMESMKGTMHETPTGTRASMAYNSAAIKEKLIAQGHDEAKADQLANELYQSSRTADGKAYKQVGNNWSFANGGGGMSNVDYVNEQLDYLKQYANLSTKTPVTSTTSTSTPTTSTTATSKTVEYKFSSGGTNVSLYGSPNDGDAMEALLSEFEMIKKSS